MGFFVSEKIPGASFDPDAGYGLGTEWSGEIVEIRPEQQQTKFGTDEPDFWPNGEKKVHLPMVIRAEQVAHLVGQDRPDGSTEDGLRVIYWDSRKRRALRDALKAIKRFTDPEPGDWVYLKWVAGVGRAGDPKQYEAQYQPGQGSGQGFFTGNGAGEQAQQTRTFARQQAQGTAAPRQPARTPAAPVDDTPPF